MSEVLDAIKDIKEFVSERFAQLELRLDSIETNTVEKEIELETEVETDGVDNTVQVVKSEEEVSLEYIKEILSKSSETLNMVLSVQSVKD